MVNVRKIYIPLVLALLVGLSACETLDAHQGPKFGPTHIPASQSHFYEQAGYLNAQDFLGPKWMQGKLYRVDPRTFNDGYANSYKIISDDYTYVVQGTEQAKERVLEIAAIEEIRKIPMVFAAADTVKAKTANLVETPIRAFNGGRNRYNTIDNAPTREDKLMVVSSGLATVVSKLGNGIKELGVTGARLVSGVAGTRCTGFGCVQKAGRDVWSGMNSIVGKHEASRLIHQKLGTDPDTDNKVLQREVDRIAYTNAYSGAGYKFGLSGAGIPVFSAVIKGVGYYNNVEFVSQYEDAEKRKKIEKSKLLAWGVPQDTVNTLYGNKAFTNTLRTHLANTLEGMGNNSVRIRLTKDAASAQTRYVAQSKLAIYRYLSKLDQSGAISGYVNNTSMAIAVRNNRTLILPFSTDYMIWSADIAELVKNYASLVGRGKPYQSAEIHILGKTSPAFKANVRNLGVRLVEIPHKSR